ncbi:MAG: hypothetical protein IPP47_31500 [Bryobacterales bacterium]|nr:hypothetical protein [Bryobacterales bacterium]
MGTISQSVHAAFLLWLLFPAICGGQSSPDLEQHIRNKDALAKKVLEKPTNAADAAMQRRGHASALVDAFRSVPEAPGADLNASILAVEQVLRGLNRIDDADIVPLARKELAFLAERRARLAECQQSADLGEAALTARRHDDATAHFKRVLEIAKTNPMPASLLDRAYRGEFAAAQAKVRAGELPVELESAGNLREAYRALAGRAPDTDPHLGFLRNVLNLRSARQEYQARDQLPLLLERYKSLEAQLTLDRERHLVPHVKADIAELDLAVRATLDRESLANLALGEELLGAYRFKEADAAFQRVTRHQAKGSPELDQRARLGLVRSDELDKREPTFLGVFWAAWFNLRVGFAQLAEYSIYLVSFFTLFLASTLVRGAWRREGLFFSFVDASGITADSPSANAAVTKETQLAIRSISGSDGGRGRIDATSDIDGSAQVNMRMGTSVSSVAALMQSPLPIKFGPVSFDFAKLLSAATSLFRRRYELTAEGTLAQAGGRLTFSITLIDRRRRWRSSPTSIDAYGTDRAMVIRDAGFQLFCLVARSEDRFTHNWRSLRATVLGLEALQSAGVNPPGRSALVEQAVACFQEALLFDTRNCEARLGLATALRKSGQNRLSATHLELLEGALKRDEEFRARAIALRPDLLFLLRYNKAVALSKIESAAPQDEANELFEKLIEEKDRVHSFLAWSGQLAAQAAQWDRRARVLNPTLEEEGNKILLVCKQLRDQLDGLASSDVLEDRAGYDLARSVALNALGRVASRLGRRKEGRDALLRAMAVSPDFVDPYINLAAVTMDGKAEVGRDWPLQAQALLECAARIDPSNLRLAYQRARLYTFEVFDNPDQGLEALKGLGPDPSIDYLRGVLYRRKGMYVAAAAELSRSLSLEETEQTLDHLVCTVIALKPEEGREQKVNEARNRIGRLRERDPHNVMWKRLEDQLTDPRRPRHSAVASGYQRCSEQSVRRIRTSFLEGRRAEFAARPGCSG